MSDLSEFLLARIAEDEAVAENWPETLIERPGGGVMMDDRGHPIYAPRSKVMAECRAKRRLVQLHRPSPDDDPRFDPHCVGCWEAGGEDGAPSYPCPTARLLALPYVDHPGYREEWRP